MGPENRPRVVVVVCESDADRRTCASLVCRVLRDTFGEQLAPDNCEYRALDDKAFLRWASVREEVKARRVRQVHGHFQGEPAEPDARNARRALFMIKDYVPGVTHVVLLRDGDSKRDERIKGLDQARRHMRTVWPVEVAIGVAEPCREAWLIAAFKPRNNTESATLEKLSNRLGFNPTDAPHRLKARSASNQPDIKAVHAQLFQNDLDREQHALKNTPRHELNRRGDKTGLPEFLHELDTIVAEPH